MNNIQDIGTEGLSVIRFMKLWKVFLIACIASFPIALFTVGVLWVSN